MQEQKNLSKREVEKLIKEFPIKPLFNKVIITLNKEEVDNDIVLSDNVMSEYQYVVAKGSTVLSDLNLGDYVLVDLERLMVNSQVETEHGWTNTKHIKVDPIFVDGIMFCMIEDRYIKGIDLRS